MNNLTPAEQEKFRLLLEARFPWLLDEDEDANGADVVDELSELHTQLKKKPRKRAARPRRRSDHEDTPSLQDRGIWMPDYNS
jgi:hypothetical protein